MKKSINESYFCVNIQNIKGIRRMEMEGMEVFPIDKDIKEIFCSHLKNNRHQFVENWKNKMIISKRSI